MSATWNKCCLRIAGPEPLLEHCRQVFSRKLTLILDQPAAPDAWQLIFDAPFPEDAPLSQQLGAVVGALDRDPATKSVLAQCTADVFCGFSSMSGQGSLHIPPQQLARLGAYGLPLILDLYPPCEPEAQSARQDRFSR
jgi:hypothetical protein